MSGLKNTKTLACASFLTAIGIIAGFLKIPVSSIIEIRFTTPVLAAAGILFGPGIAAVIGALTDIGGFIIKPTGPYFPGFTISGIISGLIFGLLLHRRNGYSHGFYRICIAVIVNTVIVNLVLNSLWLAVLYGKGGFLAVLSARALKELIMIPVNIIMIAALDKPVHFILKRSSAAL